MADNRIRVTATATGAGEGTDWLQLRGQRNFFDVSLSGSFSQTIELQRKRPGEADGAARTVESHTAPVEKMGEMQGHWDVRLWATAHSSGSSALELGT